MRGERAKSVSSSGDGFGWFYRGPKRACSRHNSGLYLLHATTFAYGSKLVQSNEMRFDQVLQYMTFLSL